MNTNTALSQAAAAALDALFSLVCGQLVKEGPGDAAAASLFTWLFTDTYKKVGVGRSEGA